jgi:glycyl-tRNA synthetase
MTQAISNSTKSMDAIVALCRRRGFIFQSSEIYGGIGGFWDYGPLGALLKNNIRDRWWRDMVLAPPMGPDGRELDIVGLDCAIISHPKVWEASGHIAGFADPMVDCKKCKSRFRADQVAEAACPLKPSKRPGECGGELTEPRQFNLMFQTYVGALADEESRAYLL